MIDSIATNVSSITSKWWLLLLRGVAAIAMAVIAFVRPGDALVALVLVLGIYALVAGVLALAAGMAGVGGDHWWAVLLEGMTLIVFALLVWSWPIASTLAFVYFIAAWLVVSGVLQVAAGMRLHDVIPNEWLYILSGIISVVFGVWIFRSGAQGVLATAYFLGWYFLFYGIAQAAVAFRLRALHGSLTRPAKTA